MATGTMEISGALRDATERQPAARAALAAALASGPAHAYLFTGPPGSGKRAAARAFAAELLALGASDPDDARRRALSDPSPHPDLEWLRPRGTQHLVEDVRARVITAASYRPFEGGRRVFVIEAADAMADEAQNALLKTLEEPAGFAHLLLLSSDPDSLLETVRSRCQSVRFSALAPQDVVAILAERELGADDAERQAVARLAGGDAERAAFLVGEEGRELRAAVEAWATAAISGDLGSAPWRDVLDAAETAGARASDAERERARADAVEAEANEPASRGRRRSREGEESARRAGRRSRTEALDLALALLAAWLRDLAAVGEGAGELVATRDRSQELELASRGLDPRRARRGAEFVMDARRRLRVNVSEELALEALTFRLDAVLVAA